MYQLVPDPDSGDKRWINILGYDPDFELLLEQAQQQSQVIPAGLEKPCLQVAGHKKLDGK